MQHEEKDFFVVYLQVIEILLTYSQHKTKNKQIRSHRRQILRETAGAVSTIF